MNSSTQGGVDCVVTKVRDEGKDWLTAGFECRSAESPVLTLRIFT